MNSNKKSAIKKDSNDQNDADVKSSLYHSVVSNKSRNSVSNTVTAE